MKTNARDFPTVEVAVTIISKRRSKRILAVFNPRWGSFTLPMTKRKYWEDPKAPAANRPEDIVISAVRAGAEVLGTTFDHALLPKLLLREAHFHQSDSEGKWKRYDLHIFGLQVSAKTRFAPCTFVEWLTPADFAAREPVSGTARFVIALLQKEGKLPP